MQYDQLLISLEDLRQIWEVILQLLFEAIKSAGQVAAKVVKSYLW